MTVPIPEPTPPAAPAAPATPPAPIEPKGPAAPAATAPLAPAAPAANPWDDPEAAKAEIEKLRRENGSARTTAKAQAAEEARKELAASLSKILDPDAAPLDPAKLTESLTTETRQARVELAVFRNAGTVGDPLALLDSTSFLKSLDGIDPHDATAVKAAIATAVAANPRLSAATPATPRTPAPLPGQGGSGGGAPDQAALIAEATAKGDWQTAIALETQKLATAPKP